MKQQMKISISHRTALSAIRQYRIDNQIFPIVNKINSILLNKRCYTDSVIDLLVDNKNQCHKCKNIAFHLRPKTWLPKSKFALTNNIDCVCPELLVIEMANILNYEHLFLLITELCGSYSINEENNIFVPGIEPATSVQQIKNYLKKFKYKNPGYRGVAKLDRVLEIATDSSASPIESRLYLKLCGPRKRGFYSAKNLVLNKPIKLSSEAALIAGQNFVIPDISNKEHKIAIEYDSAQFHENSEQGQKDKRRRDALVYDGWKVHSFVPAILNNTKSFHVKALQILNELECNSRIRNKNFDKLRDEAFRKIQ